jgi:hypothetical protein
MAAGPAEAAAWTITRLSCRIDIPKPLFGRRKMKRRDSLRAVLLAEPAPVLQPVLQKDC